MPNVARAMAGVSAVRGNLLALKADAIETADEIERQAARSSAVLQKQREEAADQASALSQFLGDLAHEGQEMFRRFTSGVVQATKIRSILREAVLQGGELGRTLSRLNQREVEDQLQSVIKLLTDTKGDAEAAAGAVQEALKHIQAAGPGAESFAERVKEILRDGGSVEDIAAAFEAMESVSTGPLRDLISALQQALRSGEAASKRRRRSRDAAEDLLP